MSVPALELAETAGEARGHARKARPDRLIALAAAPTFALMAAADAMAGPGSPAILRTAGHGASALTGMAAMYLLMSVFHCPPWLRLTRRWQATG